MIARTVSRPSFIAALALTAGCSSYSATIVQTDAGAGTSGRSIGGNTSAIAGSSALSTAGASPGASSATGGASSSTSDLVTTLGGTPNAGGASAATSVTGGTTPLGATTAGGASSFASGGVALGGASVVSTIAAGGTTGGTAGVGGAALGGASAVSTIAAGGTPVIASSAQGGTSAVITSAPAGGVSMTGGAGSVAEPTGGALPTGGATSVTSTAAIGGVPALGGTSATGGSSADACANQPCRNGGNCTRSGASYTCGCVGGYFGPQCETAHFEWLGRVYAAALGISSDGKVVVGSITSASGKDIPAMWTKETGFVALESKSDPLDQGRALAANADGTVIAGQAQTGTRGGAFRWNASEGLVYLGLDIGSVATGVSASGNAIVGSMSGPTSSPGCHAFRWSPTGGVVDLVSLGGNCSIVGVSADGTLIAGNYAPVSGDSNTLPFTWTQGTGIIPVTNDQGADARALSLDGSIVVGTDNGAYRSGNTVGFKYIATGVALTPTAVNGDGTVIGGYGALPCWIWDEAHGTRLFNDVLTGLGVDLTNWHPETASLQINAISADGKTLVGQGYLNDKKTSWIARL